MSTENQVATDAATEIPASDLTSEQQPANTEVVNPETDPAKTEQETAEAKEAKAIKALQRRIDKRTADLYRERANNEQLAQRLADLERRLPVTQQDPTEDLEKVVQTKAQTLAQQIAQQQRTTEQIGGILKAGKAYSDFDAACNALNEEIPFYEANGRPSAFLSAVMEFDQPAPLLRHIGLNPELAAELADLTPTRRVVRLAAIEREMADAVKPKTSAAPKPLEPVKGTGGTKDPSEMTDAEFNAWRRRSIAQRR